MELNYGALAETETDYSSQEQRLNITRKYYSLPPDFTNTISPTAVPGFGGRWHGVIPGRIAVNGDASQVEYLTDDGAFSTYQIDAYRDETVYRWKSDLQTRRRISMVSVPSVDRGTYFITQSAIVNGPGEMRLDMPQGEYVLFRRSGPASPVDQIRYLVPVEHDWPDGYKITYAYPDAGEFPNSATDSFGRQMTFTWSDAPRTNFATFSNLHPVKVLSKIVLPDNTYLQYTYGSDVDQFGSTIQDRLQSANHFSVTGSLLWGRTFMYENSGVPYGMTGETDQNGNRLSTFKYDQSGLVASTEQAGGVNKYQIVNLEQNAQYLDFIRQVTNPVGYNLTYTYEKIKNYNNEERRLSNVQRTGAMGVQASSTNYIYYGYVGDVGVAGFTDDRGNNTNFNIDGALRPTQMVEASNTSSPRTTNTTWDSILDLPLEIQTTGLTTDYTYSSTGLIQTVKLTDTTSQTAPYSTNGQIRQWTYTWNGNGRLSSLDGPKGVDANGKNDITSYTYDTAGNLLTATDALGKVTTFSTYDANGRPGKMTDANGINTMFVYDAQGRLSSSTVKDPGNNTALDAVTSFTYDVEGRVTGVTAPATDQLIIDYDLAGRATAVRAASGEQIAYSYDGMSDVTAETVKRADATTARTITRTFDGIGRMVTEVLGTNRTTTWTYDQLDNVVSTVSARSNTTQQAFDALNRLTSTIAPDTGSTTSAYDDHDAMTSFADAKQVTTTFVRDGFGEVIQEVSPDRGTSTYYYDLAGDRIAEVDGRGQRIDYVRDALGRVTKKTPAGRPASETVTYTYDTAGITGSYGKGRLATVVDGTGTTKFSYDARGNMLTKQQVIGTTTAATLKYTYDLADRIVSMTYPSGRVVSYARDTKGRVVTVKTRPTATGTDVTLASGLTYEAFGSMLTATLGNGLTLAQSWGNDGRLATKRLYKTSGGTNLSMLTYAYDNDDNISSITDGVTAANTVAYAYDTVNRLSQSVASSGTIKRQDFTFDTNGNRSRIDYRTNATDANPVSSSTYALNTGTNQLASVVDSTGTRAISYDARGNTSGETRPGSVTVTTGYDGYGRLISYKNSNVSALAHAYNGLDDRISTATTTGSTTDTRRFVYDGDGRLLGEYGTSATNVKAETIWLSPATGGSGRPFGGDEGVSGYAPLAEVVGTTVYWVHGNHLGVPIVTTTSAAATASLTGFTRVGFPGQTQTLSDLYYNRYRDYDPNLGRYIQADPIGLAGGDNAYSYAMNNPIKITDPLGLAPRQLDPNSDECKQLARKIENLRRDIAKGKADIASNASRSNPLPEFAPGGKLRDSVDGHRQILKTLEDTLQRREQEYAQKCGGDHCPNELQSTAKIGLSVGAGYLAYRMLRFLPSLAPPLWETIPLNLAIP